MTKIMLLFFGALSILTSRFAYAAPATELAQCKMPANAQMKSFCEDRAVQKLYADTMTSRERFKDDKSPAAKALYDQANGWPTALIDSCKSELPTCPRDKILRYMLAMMPQIEKVQQAQTAPVLPANAEGAALLKTLIGSYKLKDHYSIKILEAKPGVMFIEAEFFGPYDASIKMAGSRCRYIGGAPYKGANAFELSVKAFTAPVCRLTIAKKASALSFTVLDDSCEDFCGHDAYKKVHGIPLMKKQPVGEDEKYLKNTDEYKAASKP